jgi:glutathione S-transferase
MTTRCLFELVTEDGCSISPYVWRTKYALAAKGLSYESCGVGFVDIPAIGSGAFSTLPILEDGERQVGDSWAIAAYLDQAYPDPQLFSSEGERALALFFEKWLAVEVISNLFRICVLDIHDRLRQADRVYFRESREARLGQTLEAAHALQPMRLALRQNRFIGGRSPGYADFIAIGAFIWGGSVATIDLLERDDPLRDWLDECLDLYGGIAGSLPLIGLGSSLSKSATQWENP